VTPGENGAPAGLPAGFATAWGVGTPAAKGPKPGLNLDRIVEAGLRVATEDGLAAVSMSRVANELGTSAMSLYRYVTAKDELLALMADAALGDVAEVAAEDGWRPSLERWAWSELAAYRRHPWALRIPVKGPPLTPNSVAFLEQGLRCLAGTPLEPGEKMGAVLTTTSYTRAWAVLATQLEAARPPVPEAMTSYADTLRALTDPTHFPALHEILAANVFDEDGDDPDRYFRFGLARLLDGFAALITHRAGSSAPP
jgi:AcrR family transcriptional regulator